MPGDHESQKRMSDPMNVELQMVINHQLCGYWETNPGSLQDQQVLLPTKPCLQHPLTYILISICMLIVQVK